MVSIKVNSFKKQFQVIKDRVKPLLLFDLVTFFTDQKDIILYDEITKQFAADMGTENIIRPVQLNYYNSYIIQWYLFRTKKLLGSVNMLK